jgi:hypothetical protein
MSLITTLRGGLLAAAALCAFGAVAHAQVATQVTPMTPDIDGKFVQTKVNYDYDKRVVMIPMRDGTKLYTVIVVPKGGKSLPILLTRTPYNAAARAARADSSRMVAAMPQGDEPFVDPALVDALVVAVRQGAVIATACAPFEGDPAEPSRVKVVRSAKGQALYFSRAPIPAGGPYYQHIGLYAFRRATLLQVTALPPSPLEQSERLEQLRWLEAGLPIQLVPTQAPSLAVDTPADLARARAMLGAPKQGGDP